MPKIEPPDEFRPVESPVAWFVELQLAVDRGDFVHAGKCQRELARLGWHVDRRKPQKPRAGKGGVS